MLTAATMKVKLLGEDQAALDQPSGWAKLTALAVQFTVGADEEMAMGSALDAQPTRRRPAVRNRNPRTSDLTPCGRGRYCLVS